MADASAGSAPRAFAALLAGGGSGGHVFPALAVATELAREGWRVSWAGSAQGMEGRLVPTRGIVFHDLPARPMVGHAWSARLSALATLARSTWKARAVVRREAIDVVLGTGGYASAPAVLGARLAGRPALLVEPNAHAGAANRWLSRFAAGAAVAYPETASELACPSEVTGVPVREELFAVPALAADAGPLRLLVLGGSQGARRLNELLPAALAALTRSAPGIAAGVRVVHQCGASHLEVTRAARAMHGLAPERYEVVAFLDDVAAALAGADLIVSRAGAITLAELCAAGRPALLLPLALAGGHQIDNARRLEHAGAARLLLDAEATPAAVASALAELVGERQTLVAMAAAARTLAHPGAAAAIAALARLVVERRRRAA